MPGNIMLRVIAVAAALFFFAGNAARAADDLAAGLKALNKNDYARADAWYTKAVEAGNRDAARELGIVYLRGAKDPVNGVKWYRRAAEMGDELARKR